MSRMVPSTGKRPASHEWTSDEIHNMSDADFLENEESITAALRAGKVQRKDPGPNPKSVS